MFKRNKKGQSTMEYVIMATAVMAVIIGFVASDNSPFRSKLNSLLGQAANDMDSSYGKLSDSHSPLAGGTE